MSPIFLSRIKSIVSFLLFFFLLVTANAQVRTTSPTSNGSGSKNEVYDVVEAAPIPAGGMQGWMNYLSQNLLYPTNARRKGIEGTVIVAFVVNTDGMVSDFEILRGIGGGCDEEAIRIVKGSLKWTPGMQDSKAIRTRMRLPLTFKLGDPDPSGNDSSAEFRSVALLPHTDGQDPSQKNT